jgi:hypothetical protein
MSHSQSAQHVSSTETRSTAVDRLGGELGWRLVAVKGIASVLDAGTDTACGFAGWV